MHAPPTQGCPIAHGMPHPPQCIASLWVSTSQPSAKTVLQSRKAPVHVSAHAPETHIPLAFAAGASAHESSHEPQSVSVPSILSQPSPAVTLQLA